MVKGCGRKDRGVQNAIVRCAWALDFTTVSLSVNSIVMENSLRVQKYEYIIMSIYSVCG